MRTVIFLLACASGMLLASMAAPVLIGMAFGEGDLVVRLSIVAFVGVFIAGVCVAATLGYKHSLTHNRLIVAMVFVWLFVAIIGAVPFVVAIDLPLETAFFESVSGVTTTGASTLVGREDLPRSVLFWRLQLEWVGGFLTLASVFLVLSPMAIGGIPKRAVAAEWQLELIGGKDAGIEHLRRYFPLLAYYCAATVFIYFSFVASGSDSLRSAYLTMTSISTGGFNPYDVELAERHGQPTLLVMGAVLAISSTSLFWQRYDVSNSVRGIWRNKEAWWVLVLIALLTAAYMAAFMSVGGNARVLITATSIAESFFAAASVIATSGHETRPGVIALLPEILVFSVAFIGAAVFSTASGLKVHRLGAMLVQSYRELSLLIYPSSITPTRIASAQYDEDVLVETWPMLVLLLAVLAVALFGLSGGEGSFEASMVSAMALLLNAGPLYDAYAPVAATVDTWPAYRDFSVFERMISCAIMLLGRLEFIAVFAILNLKYWLSR